jgi:membrane associated rhomboid family serine protease
MPRQSTQISSLVLVTTWIGALCVIFAVDLILRGIFGIWLADYIGLRPRQTDGLWGILGCHLLHADIHHLASNAVGLLILGLVSCWYSQGLTGLAVLYSALVSASLTWLIAPSGSIHIGASGVLFGLVGFLVFNGLFRRSWGAFLIALPIGFLASGLIPGMLPSPANKAQLISWQMHLGGFIGGALASWQLRRSKAD